jgi:hypothetical protein
MYPWVFLNAITPFLVRLRVVVFIHDTSNCLFIFLFINRLRFVIVFSHPHVKIARPEVTNTTSSESHKHVAIDKTKMSPVSTSY